MADAATSIIIADTKYHHVIHLTSISDGTGEAAVVKVDKTVGAAMLAAVGGAEAVALDLEQIDWNIQGMTYVVLLWDHTTDDRMILLNGNGYKDFRGVGQAVTGLIQTNGLKDPVTTGGTGDVLLTTVGAVATATYDITLWLKKRPA